MGVREALWHPWGGGLLGDLGTGKLPINQYFLRERRTRAAADGGGEWGVRDTGGGELGELGELGEQPVGQAGRDPHPGWSQSSQEHPWGLRRSSGTEKPLFHPYFRRLWPQVFKSFQ